MLRTVKVCGQTVQFICILEEVRNPIFLLLPSFPHCVLSISASFARVIDTTSCVYPTRLFSVGLTFSVSASFCVKLFTNASSGIVNLYLCI